MPDNANEKVTDIDVCGPTRAQERGLGISIGVAIVLAAVGVPAVLALTLWLGIPGTYLGTMIAVSAVAVIVAVIEVMIVSARRDHITLYQATVRLVALAEQISARLDRDEQAATWRAIADLAERTSQDGQVIPIRPGRGGRHA